MRNSSKTQCGWNNLQIRTQKLCKEALFNVYLVTDKNSSRQLHPTGDELRPMTKQNDVPLFANTYGFLLVNQESVKTLNGALKELQVDHKRFRPNIVTKGK